MSKREVRELLSSQMRLKYREVKTYSLRDPNSKGKKVQMKDGSSSKQLVYSNIPTKHLGTTKSSSGGKQEKDLVEKSKSGKGKRGPGESGEKDQVKQSPDRLWQPVDYYMTAHKQEIDICIKLSLMSLGKMHQDGYWRKSGSTQAVSQYLKRLDEEAKKLEGFKRMAEVNPNYPTDDEYFEVEAVKDKWVGPDQDGKMRTFYLIKFFGYERIPSKRKDYAAYCRAWIHRKALLRPESVTLLDEFDDRYDKKGNGAVKRLRKPGPLSKTSGKYYYYESEDGDEKSKKLKVANDTSDASTDSSCQNIAPVVPDKFDVTKNGLVAEKIVATTIYEGFLCHVVKFKGDRVVRVVSHSALVLHHPEVIGSITHPADSEVND